jgi:hypothetical protein
MKIQDQVCTFTQAQRIKTIGVAQSSYFIYRHWRGNGQIIVDKRKDKYFDYARNRNIAPFTEILCSAFTVAELGIMLPISFISFKVTAGKEFSCTKLKDNYPEIDFSFPSNFQITEAEARAETLIDLLENKLITVEEVNERLK